MKTKGKQTNWNKKISKYAGQMLLCSDFRKDGEETEGYLINEDGSLRFVNYLRSLSAGRPNNFCDYWSNFEKSKFLKALQRKNCSKVA